MRAKINGSEVYLKDDQAPAFSSSINKLTDPSKVSGVTSTTIKVVATVEAKRVLGTEFMAEAKRTTRPTLTIGEQGELFNSSILPLRQDRETIECFAVGGNASWFEYAKATKLNEFDYGISELITSAVQQATWTDEDSFLFFPLIDFGLLFTKSSTYDVQPSSLKPGARVHRLLNDAMAPTGLRFVAMGSFADHWKKVMVIDPQAKPSFEIATPWPWNELAEGGFNPDTYYFVPSVDGLLDLTFDTVTPIICGYDPFNPEYDGIRFRISLYDFTDQVALASYEPPLLFFLDTDYGTLTLDHDFTGINVKAGHNIGVAVQALGLDDQERSFETLGVGGVMAYSLNSGAQTLNLTASFSESFEITDALLTREYLAGTHLQLSSVAPDMTLSELIVAFGAACGLAFNTRPELGVIELWDDREYFPNSATGVSTRDWSGRIDHSIGPAKEVPDTSSSITLKWKADDTDRLLNRANRTIDAPEGFGGYVQDLGGTAGVTTIEVPFAPTVTGKLFGTCVVPCMSKYKGTIGEDDYEREPRMLIADGTASGDWKFDGSTMSVYPLVYFHSSEAVVVLPFGNANITADAQKESKDYQWKRRLRRISESSVLEAYIRIYDHEFQGFDHGMPTLVDDGSGPAWYYVQEISQHQFGTGKPTKCTLVQIPGKRVSLNPNTVVAPFPVPVTPVTPPPIPGYLGFNLTASAVQFVSGDGIIVGGQFTTYGLTTVGYFVKLNSDGSLNSTFTSNSGTGFNSAVVDIKIQSDGKIVCCGQFTAYNGNSCGGIARINADGTFDTTFNSGGAGIGTPASNYTGGLEILADGTIIMVGVFTVFNGVSGKGYIVALDPTGAVSTTFLTGTGFSNLCYNIKKDLAGKVVITGIFASYKGVSTSNVIRLNSVGTKDTSLVWPTTTPNGSGLVLTGIGMQADGKILLAGNITQYGGVTVPGVIRIANDGTLDTAFNTNLIAGGDIPASPGVVKYFADGRIFVCGKGMVALDSDGTTSSTQYITSITSTSAVIYDMAIRNDGLAAVVGSFVTINGSTALRIFSFNIGSFSDFNNDFNDDFNNGG
jgi:uncharacterized delta-60 repeat protein